MSHAYFQFHGEINDFLPRPLRHSVIDHTFDWKASIKDMVESLGVPHCEIELLVVDGKSVDFDYLVQPGVSVDVYDRSERFDLAHKVTLRPPLTAKTRFILDQHLGRLASYLRMMGFDTLYRNDYHDDELAEVSNTDQRVLLTRDLGLLKRSLVIHGRFVRETEPKLQIVEVVKRFNLVKYIIPFRRCLKCNGVLDPVDKADIVHQLPSRTAQFYDEFHLCLDCGQIYWKGPHYEQMQELMARVIAAD
jgi:uncharacterized protein